MGKMTLKPVSEAEVKMKQGLPKESPIPAATTIVPEGTSSATPPAITQPIVGNINPKIDDVKLDDKGNQNPAENKLDSEGKPIVEPRLDDKGNPIVEPEKKRKGVKEIAKPFFKKEEKIVESGEVPEPVKLKYSEYETQIAGLKKIAEDPDVQIILEAKKSGKDIFGILKEVQGIDPATYSLEQLHEIELKNQGITGDDFEEAMDDFRALKPYQQKALTNPVKNKLESEINSKKESFLSKLKEGTQQDAAENQRQVALYTKTQQEYEKLADDYIGKEHYSVTGTPAMAESLKKLLQDPNGLIPKNEDGSLNAQVLFDLAHYRLFGDLRLENLENQFFSEGVEAIEKKVEARGADAKVIRMPQATPTQDVDVAKQTFKTARPVSR